MRNFKNIVASITYYRKHNIVLFIFFTLSIFSLTMLELLSLTQQAKFAQLTDSWSFLDDYLPGNSKEAFGTISASNIALQKNYERLMLLDITVIAITLIGLAGILLYLRRQDIKSLISLGLNRGKIIFQLVIEAVFPIVLSFIVLICFSLLFQNTIKNHVVALNTNLFSQELKEQTKERGTTNFSAEGPLMTEQKTQQVLLPFKTKSFYLLETSSNFLNFSKIRQVTARMFLTLTAVSFALISAVSALYVLKLSHNMN